MIKSILYAVIIYLSFAFVIWEYNPLYWQQEDRLSFALLSVGGAFIINIINFLYNERNK